MGRHLASPTGWLPQAAEHKASPPDFLRECEFICSFTSAFAYENHLPHYKSFPLHFELTHPHEQEAGLQETTSICKGILLDGTKIKYWPRLTSQGKHPGGMGDGALEDDKFVRRLVTV